MLLRVPLIQVEDQNRKKLRIQELYPNIMNRHPIIQEDTDIPEYAISFCSLFLSNIGGRDLPVGREGELCFTHRIDVNN
jgi:hypothetical protein